VPDKFIDSQFFMNATKIKKTSLKPQISIALIEPDSVEANVLKVMMPSDKFNVIHLTNSIEAWNFFLGSQLVNLIIINLNLQTPHAMVFSKIFGDISQDEEFRRFLFALTYNY